MTDNTKDFYAPDWLKQVRGGLTKELFAKNIGVSVRHYYRYESGEQVVPQKVVDAVLRYIRDMEHAVAEPKDDYAKHGGHKPDFEKSMGVEKSSDEWDALGLLYEIVKEGDPAYRRAIMANLVAFSTAIRERKKSAGLESEVAGMKAEQVKTAGEMEKLRQELSELRAIVQTHAREVTYTGPERRLGPDRRIADGASPDGIEHRSGLERRAGGGDNGPA